MSREREWKLYFDDLFGFCEKVISYTNGLSHEKFEASSLNYDATVWNVQLYGEAAKSIPEEIRAKMPEIPWRVIIVETPKLLASLKHIRDTRPELFEGQA